MILVFARVVKTPLRRRSIQFVTRRGNEVISNFWRVPRLTHELAHPGFHFIPLFPLFILVPFEYSLWITPSPRNFVPTLSHAMRVSRQAGERVLRKRK